MIGTRIFQEGDLGLDQLQAVINNRQGLLKVIGAEGVRQFKKNFLDLGQRPNKLQAPSTGFWQEAAASTSYFVNGADFSVTINVSKVGVRLQYEGGTVVPDPATPAEVLAIPVHPDAHGKRPGDFNNLHPVMSTRNAGLARPGPVGSKVDEWMFVFKYSVTIRPHPDVVPDQQKLTDQLAARTLAWIDRQQGGRS